MRATLAILLVVWAGLVLAVEPDEIMTNIHLEERARAISKSLRCLQCRNESIDESNSEIARDLRVLVRARLANGDTDKEILDFVVSRYGEYVLLTPNGKGINFFLWLSGPFSFLVGVSCFYVFHRRAQRTLGTRPLTAQEQEKINTILPF